ncbi:MAG: Mur ligase family protein [Planctomycetota bacterium]
MAEPNRPLRGVSLAQTLTTSLPPSADVYAGACCDDAAVVRPGDVYFAPRGDVTSVLPHAQRAAERGAAAIVTEQLLPLSSTPQYVVDSTRAAFGTFCHRLVGDPSLQITCVAVAGAYGKSSTAVLLESILSAAGASPAVCPSPAASSAAVTASWLAEQAADGATHALFEASEAAALDGRLDGLRLRAACLTNLAGAVPSREQSHAHRRAVLTAGLDQLGRGGLLAINADDQPSCRLLSEWLGQSVTHSTTGPADLVGTVTERHSGGQVLALRWRGTTAAVSTATIGDAHAQNCLAAAATAVGLGVDLVTVAKGLESAPPLPVRMQPVSRGQGFPVLLDASRDSATVARAAAAVSATTPGRLLTVIDCGAATPATDESAASLLAAASGRNSAVIAVRGRGRAKPNGEHLRWVDDRFTAIALAVALAEEGDAVLVTGCDPDAAPLECDEHLVSGLIERRLANTPPAAVGRAA